MEGRERAEPPSPRKLRKITMRPIQEIEEDEARLEPSFAVEYGDSDKLSKITKNPLVPAGAIATAGVLVGGLLAFRNGNFRLSQQLMRARILAQGATLGILSLSVARTQYVTTPSTADDKQDAVGDDDQNFPPGKANPTHLPPVRPDAVALPCGTPDVSDQAPGAG